MGCQAQSQVRSIMRQRYGARISFRVPKCVKRCYALVIRHLSSASVCLIERHKSSRLPSRSLVVEHFLALQPRQREYRRGLDVSSGKPQWQSLWHFDDGCETYPARNFMIKKDRPPDDELCSRCDKASRH
jgi:hypothetical protein